MINLQTALPKAETQRQRKQGVHAVRSPEVLSEHDHPPILLTRYLHKGVSIEGGLLCRAALWYLHTHFI